MATPDEESAGKLLAWRDSLDPLKVDLVGDFSGKERFAIHGESLVAHCIGEANVDFEGGFQLLHAVHAVESFLSRLRERGLYFHILWFDCHEAVAVPSEAARENAYKYLLTRAVLIEHLRSVDINGPISFRFPSLDSNEFRDYARQTALYFFMCLDRPSPRKPLPVGPASDGEPTLEDFPDDEVLSDDESYDNCLSDEDEELSDKDGPAPDCQHVLIMFLLGQLGYNLAFMNTVEFVSSKVYSSVLTSAASIGQIDVKEPVPQPKSDYGCLELYKKFESTNGGKDSIGRADLVIMACSTILANTELDSMHSYSMALLVHLILLEHGDLAQRPCDVVDQVDEGLGKFLEGFSIITTHLIDNAVQANNRPFTALFDLIDGRLFRQTLKNLGSVRLTGDSASSVRQLLHQRMELIKSLCGVDMNTTQSSLPILNDPTAAKADKPNESKSRSATAEPPRVLPFSHPIMDKYLKGVDVETDAEPKPTAASESKVFHELTHWHNAKKPLDPKVGRISKPLDWRAQRRNQRFMADTIAYSASLTSTSGKNIDPEIIVVQQAVPATSQSKALKAGKGEAGNGTTGKPGAGATGKPAPVKPGKAPAKGKKQPPKSNKELALEAANARQAEKAGVKSRSVVTFWIERCREFEKEHDPTNKYLKSTRYLSALSKSDMDVIGAEVSLYACNALSLFRKYIKDLASATGMSTLALAWSFIQSMQSLPLTSETQKYLEKIATAIRFPLRLPDPLARPAMPAGYRLPFNFSVENTELYLKLSSDPQEFQLQHCGPYLERSFDSADDSRVPFQPDAWQRKVLDAIDDNKSLLVAAPTSAGKTFISFYAMKKILQSNDDDVIVYVAPTKALVNQIAAEVQARFSKSYGRREGKSVWAIHTRDYRVNNPTGCQVLVTVPEILEILLLAPSNAQKPTSWSNRVKRIIFDEVHCIGQAEDGVIWEQLLLLAPCPIIALSATVGNPAELKDWLVATQKAKGFELEMVVHTARYSDLRKYFYLPSENQKFKGMVPYKGLPIPGLDTQTTNDTRFATVHPVGGMRNRDKGTLSDIAWEPRDCFEVWKAMQKHQNASYPVDPKLAPPKRLPSLIKKSDVVEWEEALKDQLHTWMMDSQSPFNLLQKDLQPQILEASIRSVDTSHNSQERDSSVLSLLTDLRSHGALPALVFNYDRVGCENALSTVMQVLEETETEYRDASPVWAKKLEEYEKWKKLNAKAKYSAPKSVGKRRTQDDGAVTKEELAQENASREASPWESFDPEAPLPEFSFGDHTKITKGELEERLDRLQWIRIKPELLNGLRRGVGIHHAGMNRQYRQVVEMLFRKGYLTVVIATGTLALGINMPCKTVIFYGDSVSLTALNYRQAAGRAGRRGFDSLGNIVFHGIKPPRAMEIMSSRLPDLKGHFPTSVSLILRLFGLMHGTNNSDFAARSVNALLTQTRLYLGGPDSEMTIKHHVRFSIEYLRRHSLLSAEGVPQNFAGLVGHLYYTENSVFAFHALLKSGYFHKMCSGIKKRRSQVLLRLMLVLCHLFCRVPCGKYNNKAWLREVVNRSPSIVVLPPLPPQAERILQAHNSDTKKITETYVRSYVHQHLEGIKDDVLPFSRVKAAPTPAAPIDLTETGIPFLAPTTIRSPFAALSGFTDKFDSIRELCTSTRDGVFLEDTTVPYLPVSPKETGGVPFNAYIYDFYKHGDMDALVRDNGIKNGDVWFHLKDFSLVLATVIASLANFLDPNVVSDDAAMIDVQDAGDELVEGFSPDDETSVESITNGMASVKTEPAPAAKPKGKKGKVADSWESQATFEEDQAAQTTATNDSAADWEKESKAGENLTNVYRAFKLLQTEFDEKFRKVWA